MTVCYLNIYAIIYAETGSNWGYTGFSGAPVTGSGLGLGYEVSTQTQTGLGSGSRPSTQTGSCGSLSVTIAFFWIQKSVGEGCA